MSLQSAPFYGDAAQGPADGRAYWLNAADGVRLRVALWNQSGAQGTVLVFPGRTEYAEKYGRAAADLAQRGYCSLAIDWRGQGLADRLLPDQMLGHVGRFADYQLDVLAMVEAAQALGLPGPYFLLTHSMGGCIGLRALHQGLGVQAAAFSAPMWGIEMPTAQRMAAWAIGWVATQLGQANRLAPGTQRSAYLASEPFENNTLTTDVEMFDCMRQQLAHAPGFALGGPTVHWVYAALGEMAALARLPAPPMPCITFLGTNERIVSSAAIHRQMGAWPGGQLVMLPKAEHEVMMEQPHLRRQVFDQTAALFAANHSR